MTDKVTRITKTAATSRKLKVTTWGTKGPRDKAALKRLLAKSRKAKDEASP